MTAIFNLHFNSCPVGLSYPFLELGLKFSLEAIYDVRTWLYRSGKKGKSPCHCMFPSEGACKPAYSRLIDMYALGAWLAPPRIHRASLNYLQRKSSKCLSVVGCHLFLCGWTLVKIQDSRQIIQAHGRLESKEGSGSTQLSLVT